MSCLRVVLVCGWYYPDSVGGTEAYVRSLAQGLTAQGVEVAVAAPAEDGRASDYEWEGIPVHRYPIALEPSRAELRGTAPPEHLAEFEAWLKELSPAIVHFHSLTRGVSTYHARAAREIGARVIHTLHVPGVTCARGTLLRWGSEVCDGEMRVRRCAACYLHGRGAPKFAARALAHTPARLSRVFAGAPGRTPLRALGAADFVAGRSRRVRELLESADRVVVLCQWMYDVMLRNGIPAARLVLCRHGLSDDQIRDGKRARELRQHSPKLRVGYVGRFDPVKGVHVLVEAVRQLPLSAPVELRLYGRAQTDADNAYLAKLGALAGGDSRIVFAGEMTAENRAAAWSELDVLAAPSLCLETGPYVVLEAFAAGIPVLGSNLGGIAELVKDGVNGWLVGAGNVAEWSRALAGLSAMKTRVITLQQEIKAPTNSQNVVLDMLALYRKVMEG